MLEKREMLLHKKMAAELEKAKDFNRAKNKRAALQCLKKKKLYEQQIEQLQNQQLKLEEQVITLEGSKTTAETFTALKSGAGAMKQLHKETNIDEVDKVRPDLSSKESNPKDLTVDLTPYLTLTHTPTHSLDRSWTTSTNRRRRCGRCRTPWASPWGTPRTSTRTSWKRSSPRSKRRIWKMSWTSTRNSRRRRPRLPRGRSPRRR